MKLLISATVFCLLAGAPAFAHQDESNKPQEPQQPQQEEPKKPKPQQPVDKPQEPNPPESPKPARPPQEKPPEEKPAHPKQPQDNPKEKPPKEKQQQGKEQQSKGNRKATAPGNARAQRIPEEQFRAHFGPQHHFHVQRWDRDNQRFFFVGYWFEYTEVWPMGWDFDDDFFIIEADDIYYLCDPRFPDTRLVVVVVEVVG